MKWALGSHIMDVALKAGISLHNHDLLFFVEDNQGKELSASLPSQATSVGALSICCVQCRMGHLGKAHE